ncbi:MAG: NADH-quinone oxidoreductase subunit N [bacterium]
MQQNVLDIHYLIPELILFCTFAVMLAADQVFKRGRKKPVAVMGIAGMGLLIVSLWQQSAGLAETGPVYLFSRMMMVDPFSIYFKWIFAMTTMLTLILAMRSKEIEKQNEGEFYTLIVFVCLGMSFLCSSTHLLMIFLSFEMISILSYVLAGYLRGDPRSSESGIKYMIYGAFTTGIMIYGMSMLYGLTGSLEFHEIHDALQGGRGGLVPVTVTLLMISSGMLFKIAAAPFHMWSPDVYEGAPTVATAFFSVGPKAAGFAVFLRFLLTAFGPDTPVDWHRIIEILSILTMTIGNYTALRQENVKRMLAYSSIAQAGYILMGLAVLHPDGRSAILFYLAVYMIMNMGAFLVVLALENTIKSAELKDYRGIGLKSPLAAAAMVIFLISLTGLPPTAGFVGKFLLFKAVMDQKLYVFALIGVLNSVVSLVYYLRVVKAMYLEISPDPAPAEIRIPFTYAVLLVILIIPVIYLGLFFQPMYELSIKAVFG